MKPQPPGRRKRALEDDDRRSPRALYESEIISPRLVDVQVGLSTSVGGHVGIAEAGAERGRVTGAIKSRRLSESVDASPAVFVTKLTSLSGPVSPTLPFTSAPFEMKKAGGLGHPIFTLGQARPAISTPLGTPGHATEQQISPRLLEGGLTARVVGSGISPLGSQILTQEQKSPVLQGKPEIVGEKPRAGRGLPTISDLLGPGAQDNNKSPVFGSLNTPYRVPTVTSTTAPSSKQVTKREPFPLNQRRNLESVKGIRTPLLDSGGARNITHTAPMLSFDADDVSSDEELIGIPGPDIPDPDISFSQEKLGDLSVTENNLEETAVLTLCDGLANSLTKVERDRMELLNLYTIALAQQPSPIVLGRDQFQDVFGDNIRGGMLSHLSRRHCLIHVENMSSQDESARMGVKVRIEDTSTNGIKINGLPLKNGQSHELQLNDIVTLMRIRRGEEDVSLEYKLIRADPGPEKSKRRSRKSRHDGRFVRPSDKFSCELLDVSNRHGLSPVQESDGVSPVTVPARAIAQDMRHEIPAGLFTPADTSQSSRKKEDTSKAEPFRPMPILARRIQCTVLFADQSTQDFSETSQPLEEANFDYREELSEILSSFASIRSFDASSYHCATIETIEDALNDDSDVVFYTGGGDEDHLVVEGSNGLSARLEKDDIRQLLSEAGPYSPKLIVVIAPSLGPANRLRTRLLAFLLAECGAPHVCFLSSTSKHSLRVTSFIRALTAGLLKGYSIEKSYILAEFVALNDLLPIVRPTDQICKLLPSSKRHNNQIGSPITEAAADRNVIALLNALFIPVLATHFLGRDVQVRKVKAALAQKIRVCNVHGPRGVGKSSIAIHVAKMSYRTRGYRNGVHYFAVDKLVEHIQNGINSVLASSHDDEYPRPSTQREDPLPKVIEGVETLLHSLPETDPANYPTTLLVLDGCDVVLPALEVFVLNIIRSFPSVQILVTSTEKLQLDTDGGDYLREEAIHVKELGKADSAKLFFKLARGHLTSRQFRHLFPDSSIDAISNDERLLGTKGNPFRISRLVYQLESQTAIGN
ncbi:FHA(forkhead-associated) domain-containing protein [Phytophthora infestans]|uniref:FHA(Forkhead-associated) domain-containing protein n=1 Tax=Phytophthora infestans TaxID=4787 RepID=A0A8S9TX54_PHYIN|nr:FHA(forkhead-associated) domain-containing protein [Phytophthora infestans]